MNESLSIIIGIMGLSWIFVLGIGSTACYSQMPAESAMWVLLGYNSLANSGELVTTGAFAISHNPIYTAFGLVLIGIFLIIPNWIVLIYVFAGIWLFNRQILLEEQSLKRIYCKKYTVYCKKVRRFL